MTNTLNLSERQQEFLTQLELGRNIFLTGKAGTGKSFIVKEAITRLKESGKNIIALAPTGVAANNIGGQTIHSFFAINPFGVLTEGSANKLRAEKRRLINKVDVIFIDEVSMLRPDLLDGIDYTLKKNKCKRLNEFQLVLIGDLKQLPAPMDDNFRSVLMDIYRGEEFYNANCFDALNIHKIELDEVLRQSNPEFIESLNIIRNGGKSDYFRQFVTKEPKGIIIAPHNATVSAYNHKGLESLDTPEFVFDAVVTGNAKAEDFNVESRIRVKHGCKIMYLINSKNNPLVNGTLGTFIEKEGSYFIRVGLVDYSLELATFTKIEYVLNDKGLLELSEIGTITQYPIKVAYALTIHKSQGLTFEEVTVDLSLPCFQRGQMYTALSRVTGPEGLAIITR